MTRNQHGYTFSEWYYSADSRFRNDVTPVILASLNQIAELHDMRKAWMKGENAGDFGHNVAARCRREAFTGRRESTPVTDNFEAEAIMRRNEPACRYLHNGVAGTLGQPNLSVPGYYVWRPCAAEECYAAPDWVRLDRLTRID